LISHTVTVTFIQIPYMKVSPLNPPRNKIRIISIFIRSKEICEKNDFLYLLMECGAQIGGLTLTVSQYGIC